MVSQRLDLVTLTAISISVASLLIVIVCAVSLRRQVTSQPHTENGSGIEVSAIVSEFGQRLRRLEENLVDQRVKLEVAQLRLQRSGIPMQFHLKANSNFESLEPVISNGVQPMQSPTAKQETIPSPIQGRGRFPERSSEFDKRSGNTEHEALRLVLEGKGKMTARDIQERIGRTREHAARMMNGLFQEGLVERDISARPFTYSITQKGLDALSS